MGKVVTVDAFALKAGLAVAAWTALWLLAGYALGRRERRRVTPVTRWIRTAPPLPRVLHLELPGTPVLLERTPFAKN